ncbi:MAG: DNA repair protein RecO [Candidatus Buchananbacteria bacterium RBG_13_39_9]|uniref:DNA repair protein RecO n=1 Tax=Candidatus Buchananbacteria bacterium RBG_13_39_9 TaxID=1797531 RepID=A0A1G1XP56_9BACT|nr:MAG: DNA repair protein RecO [Candidatus Buchananbacteria bacterium RBG_13_39_9]
MSQTYTTTALVLKRRDHNEYDRLFCLYTKDYGKIDVLAKGTKKIVSKLNPYLEPFYLIKVMIAKGKVFDKLANCNLIKPYQNLRQDLFGFALINYLSEVIDGLIHGQTMSSDKFELLINTLDILEEEISNSDKERLLMLANIFNLKLLNLLGYQPEVKRCLNCHRGILLPKNVFDFSHGGIICEQCKKVCLIEDYILVSDQVIKLLQLAQEKDLDFFSNLGIDQDTIKKFNQIVYKLLLVNMERPLKSIEFIKKL